MEYKMHEGSLYSYTAGIYAGVLVKENIMKRLVKLQTKHLEDVKRILLDGVDNDEVFPYGWTLHYPEGKQTQVTFIDKTRDVRRAIKSATTGHHPKYEPVVFIADSMEEAQSMAEARHEKITNCEGV